MYSVIGVKMGDLDAIFGEGEASVYGETPHPSRGDANLADVRANLADVRADLADVRADLVGRSLEVRSAPLEHEVDILRRSRSAVKGDRVAADEDGLNPAARELRQQFSEVGG